MVGSPNRPIGWAIAAGLIVALAACEPKAPQALVEATNSAKTFDPNDLDVPYLATPDTTVAAMLDIGALKPGEFVIDLGSGDGRILVTAAQRGATGFGVDIDPKRIAEANANAQKAGVADKVSFRRQDLFETPLGQADLLTMYLLPEVNLQLRPRILSEVRPGTRVVSHAFDMGGWRPDATGDNGGVFLWIVPAAVQGSWRIRGGGVDGVLKLKQSFQDIEGTVDGKAIRDAALRGDRIDFIAATARGERRFRGIVAGDRITPATDGAPWSEAASGWTATRVK